jgi:hypothetical protein
MRGTISSLSLLLLLSMPLETAYSQMAFGEGKDSLRGLQGVGVVASARTGPGGKVSASEELRTEVEQRLRKWGIRVLNRDEVLQSPGLPILDVGMVVYPLDQGIQGFLYQISIECLQTVVLKRDPSVEVYARTWYSKRPFGITTDPEAVQKEVVELVDGFAEDYLAVVHGK